MGRPRDSNSPWGALLYALPLTLLFSTYASAPRVTRQDARLQ